MPDAAAHPDPDATGGAEGPILGYCTNVHPGTRLQEVQDNLLKHAGAVKDRVSPDQPMPIGLWLSARAAQELIGDPGAFEGFRDFLRLHGLAPFTFNAFPWGDFHGLRSPRAARASSRARGLGVLGANPASTPPSPVAAPVKHRVYRPDWSEFERLEYTVAIAAIAADLVEPGREVSISTLPVCWGLPAPGEEPCDLGAAANSLRILARHLARIEQDTGRLIHVDLEPEPGCYLDRASDVSAFFENHILRRGNEHVMRRHLRICHDICHAAVMFEDQEDALAHYARAGITVGKVQISSAIDADFDAVSVDGHPTLLAELRAFAEDRYLHQTTVRQPQRGTRFFEDLPDALTSAGDNPSGRWRTHFHVPIFAHRLGRLATTADQIAPAIHAAFRLHGVRHFEVETYAWDVLPEHLRLPTLAEGLAREVQHARAILAECLPR